ncbi:hypothetical protein [Falsirhodobacter xinxiangensis]|uniref:hypothetical protein n=1 Tax=Falsirhodobacter xinxiangensis TaxID=2530049 RepID=UPI0010A9B17E|nr:hypothetical protein [Rhodobacter xinxiangensis]
MNAAFLLVAFLIASVFFEWLEGAARPAAMVGHELTWIDWMFAIAIGAIGGPTLAIVMVRLIYWHQRRSDAARKAYAERVRDKALRDVGVSRSIEPVPADHQATIVVVSTSGGWTSGMPETVYLAAVGREGSPVPYARKDME